MKCSGLRAESPKEVLVAEFLLGFLRWGGVQCCLSLVGLARR